MDKVWIINLKELPDVDLSILVNIHLIQHLIEVPVIQFLSVCLKHHHLHTLTIGSGQNKCAG